jgi:hypothetical protein
MKNVRMISILLVLTCMPLLAALAKDKSKGGSDEQQIASLEDQSKDAAVKADTSFLENNMADDYISINPMGTESTKSETIAMRKNGQVKYDSIEVSDRKIRVDGHAAIVTFRADIKSTVNGQDMSGPYRVTRVWVKQGGKWKAASFQSTRIHEQMTK